MGKWLMRFGAIVLTVLVLIVTGCPPQEAEKPSTTPPPVGPKPPVAAAADGEAVEKEPIPIKVSETMETLTPEPKSIPEVKLPETLADTCLVAVGDALPAGELATVDGEKKDVAGMFGTKATVVFFWAAGSSEIAEKTAVSALADLQGDAQAAFGEKGLAVVAINPKDPAEKVKELLGTVEIGFPVLLDAEGSYFAKIASDKLPRVYVLDAAGKIAWFDVGFSEVSRETLLQTLPVVLGVSEATNK